MKHIISPELRHFLKVWIHWAETGDESVPGMTRYLGLCDTSYRFYEARNQHLQARKVKDELRDLFVKEADLELMKHLDPRRYEKKCAYPFNHADVHYLGENHVHLNPLRCRWVREQLAEPA